MTDYFSDRERGPRPRTEQEITQVAWVGIVTIVEALARQGAFGRSFPEQCPDGTAICGNNARSLKGAIEAELEGLTWPLPTEHKVEDDIFSEYEPWHPDTLIVLDLVEFVWRTVAKPIIGSYHDYHRHHHYTFDEEAGRDAFREDLNRVLTRNGLAYELKSDGKVRRVLPAVIGEALSRPYLRTGDSTLDVMLEESRTKFSDPRPLIRREALERLCDSWERIKSLAHADKAKSIGIILDKCAVESGFRNLLEKEARELKEIANSHLLRHHEVRQEPVIDVQHVDYLYHRLFAMIELVIRKNAPS
mgnify:CR=1 FL=1